MSQTTSSQQDWKSAIWALLRLPIEILLTGGVILLLWWLAQQLNLPGVAALKQSLAGANGTADLIGFMVFAVGIGFAAFLWWLASRYFLLIRDGHIPGTNIGDLPLALPEGTVRAVLALIVGVIGLPLLLFAKTLGLTDAIGGYVNGIITGVFGFYFGTRTSGVPTQAVNQIAAAQSQAGAATQRALTAEADSATAKKSAENHAAAADTAKQDATTARQEASVQKAAADALQRATDFTQAKDSVSRGLALTSMVLDIAGPFQGLLPANLQNVVGQAKTVVDTLQGVDPKAATDDNLTALGTIATSLLGGGDNSGLGTLIAKAAPMLSGIAIPGLGPAAGIGLLLSVGVKLGSAEFQRWRARVLAAPLATGMIEFGTLTPDEVHAALLDSPLFLAAFKDERGKPGFDATLASIVLSDDAPAKLWTAYGATAQPALFASRDDLEKGLAELRQTLLAARAANDVTDDVAKRAAAPLTNAANAALKASPDQVNAAVANQLVAAAAKASASGAAPQQAQAAFDALIMLVGNARAKGIDLSQAIAELKP